jgi:hypothetical protein
MLSHGSIEIDPNKMKDDEDSAINVLECRLLVQKIFKAITDSATRSDLPQNMRLILQKCRESVGNRFPEATSIAVGGFWFLRFVCPAIMTPHVYGLLDGKHFKISVKKYCRFHANSKDKLSKLANLSLEYCMESTILYPRRDRNIIAIFVPNKL